MLRGVADRGLWWLSRAFQGMKKDRALLLRSFRSRWLCSPTDSVKVLSGVLQILNQIIGFVGRLW